MTIKQLRSICQSSAPLTDPWYMRVVIRKISIYFTAFFVKTKLTPNQITALQIAAGLLAAILLYFDNLITAILVAILLNLSLVFDCSDGELARFKDHKTAAGLFLDGFNHILISGLLYLSSGFYLSNILDGQLAALVGSLAAIFFSLPVTSTLRSSLITTVDRGNVMALADFRSYFKKIENQSRPEKANIFKNIKLINLMQNPFKPPYNMLIILALAIGNQIFYHQLSLIWLTFISTTAIVYVLTNFLFLWYWLKNNEVVKLYFRLENKLKNK